MKRLDCLLLFALLTACAGGPYHNPPRYALPESRTAAARQLNEALAFNGIDYGDVNADKVRLRYSEGRRLAGGMKWLRRELVYSAIYGVDPSVTDGEHWAVRVDAAGGTLTLRFNDAAAAAKAESALLRLSALHAAPEPQG